MDLYLLLLFSCVALVILYVNKERNPVFDFGIGLDITADKQIVRLTLLLYRDNLEVTGHW